MYDDYIEKLKGIIKKWESGMEEQKVNNKDFND
jgi:hypothetical protein